MEHDPRPSRVLVVEDEMLVAMDIEGLLLERGYEVVGPAPTVERALALLARERPDVAMLDLNLAGEDTVPVAEELRRRGIPFVVVSGYGASRMREGALRDAPFVSKPYDRDDLARSLARALA